MVEKQKLFISYNTYDGDYYASELEKQFCKDFEVLRDNSALLVNDDFYAFMKGIAECDIVVLVLTAAYVKSMNCMLEMSYLFGQEDWDQKAMVLVIDDSLYSVDRKMEILNFWDQRQKEITERVSQEKVGGEILGREKNNVDQICGVLESFLIGVAQRVNPSQIAIVAETYRKAKADNRDAAKSKIAQSKKDVAKLIKENGALTPQEIADQLGLSLSAVRRYLPE